MKIYEVNVWEGRHDHKNWLYSNKAKAMEDAKEFLDAPYVSEVWLRVWEYKDGGMRIVENGPVYDM